MKSVDLVTRNSKHLDLHFSDFSTIFKQFTSLLFETKNWKDRFAKGPLHHAQNPLGTKNKLQRGPWPEVGEGTGGVGQFPAVSLAGGEG